MNSSTMHSENAKFRTEMARERAAKEAAASAYENSVKQWNLWLDSLPCTDDDVADMRAAALEDGDALTVAFCDSALAGSVQARRECAYVLACNATPGVV